MYPHFSLAALMRPAAPLEIGIGRPGPSLLQITTTLADLRRQGRRSIRILDLRCGEGERLIRTAAKARELGFVAIEGMGVDLSVDRIRHASREARARCHPSTELEFRVAEAMAALAIEHDDAVDLVLLSEPKPYPASPLAIAMQRVSTGPVLGA